MFSFHIDPEILESVSSVPLEKDFTFTVGDKTYKCNKFLACCLSKNVQDLLKSDATTSSISLNIDDKHHVFDRIMESLEGKEVLFTEDENSTLFQFSIQLSNQQLLDFSEEQAIKSLTIDNCFCTLNYFIQINAKPEQIIKFIAERLDQIPFQTIPKLPFEILEEIITKKQGQMTFLFLIDWIKQYTLKYGEEFSALIDSIDFEGLPDDEYLSLADTCSPESVQQRFIMKHFSKISRAIKTFKEQKEPLNMTFQPNGDGSLSGLFSFLAQHSPNNIVRDCKITMYAETNTQFLPDLVELTGPRKNKHYKNEPVQGLTQPFILFDLHEMRIEVSAYTIISCYCTEPGCEPKTWEIHGSNDNINWVLIDRVSDSSALVGRYKKKTFYVTQQSIPAVRYIKYIQIENFFKNTIIHLSGFELFGKVYNIPKDLKPEGDPNE